MTKRNVIVLGAGLAGLGFARHYPGCRVFEADDTPGGHARSHSFAGVWFDRGAHICHSSDPEWLALLHAAAPLHVMTKSTVLNHKQGKWFAYPVQNHLFDLPPPEREAALRDRAQGSGGAAGTGGRATCGVFTNLEPDSRLSILQVHIWKGL